jgi:hypothetical protein
MYTLNTVYGLVEAIQVIVHTATIMSWLII